MTFYRGQKVECVDDESYDGEPTLIRKGHKYTITDSFDFFGREGVRLEEVDPGYRLGWYASRFRPLVERKTDISVFTAMLDRSKQTERA